MRRRRIEEQLKVWAVEEGFHRAGIARLGPSSRGAAFERWLEEDGHAGMAYMERRREERFDPRRLLEGARSAVCVALQYHPLAAEDEVEGDLWPRVARYARGDDYHLVMERRLRRLGERVEAAFPGSRTRSYVDTGPLLERELAEGAGLGVTGKNTCLLHPEGGSWFLLGELLLTLDLEPDSGFADLCGSCTACLDACPTGALPEPFRLDSRRCISYWTIEHRGAVPEEVRPMLGDWVFGCDICQEVCPLNTDVAPAVEPALGLPPARRVLGLADLLGLGREEYVERFRRSPMKRSKLEGLQRNAAMAMGNRRDSAYVEPLGRALREASALVREHAAWALGRIGGPEARRQLESAGLVESEREVGRAIEKALAGPV
jgi:epoxyqueuosine reductase